jgi:hypothetical protein
MSPLPRQYWTAERLAWLAEAYRTHPLPGLVDHYNAHWSITLTRMQLKAALSNHRITSGRPHGSGHIGKLGGCWTLEQVDWLRTHRDDGALTYLTPLFNAAFGIERTKSQLHAACQRHQIRAQRDYHWHTGHPTWNKGVPFDATGTARIHRFKPGHEPSNRAAIGEYRKTTQGYWEVKCTNFADRPASNANWQPLHRLLWVENHGPIPAAHVVVFLDGDSDHLDIANLACVHRAVCNLWHRLRTPTMTPAERRLALDRAQVKHHAYTAGKRLGLAWPQIKQLFSGEAA